MITVHMIEGLACPFFSCDVCRERIDDIGLAWAVWGEGPGDETCCLVHHVHKGPCLRVFEGRLPDGADLASDELSDRLAFLSANCGGTK